MHRNRSLRLLRPLAVLALLASAVSLFGSAADARTRTSLSNACPLASATLLTPGRLVATPAANGCDLWQLNLQVGDRLLLRVAAGTSGLQFGFLIPGLTDSDLASVNVDLRGTACQGTIDAQQGTQVSCRIGGTHAFYLRVIQYDPNASAQIGAYVTHAKPKPVIGTCDIFAKPARLPINVTEYGDDYQSCPTNAREQYLGINKSPYPYLVRWLLHITRAGQALTLSGSGAPLAVGDVEDVQVLKPGLDPTDYPSTDVVFIPGHNEVCRLEWGGGAASTRCVFPRPGNYIVALSSPDTISFKFR